jgi:hypothetical protein
MSCTALRKHSIWASCLVTVGLTISSYGAGQDKYLAYPVDLKPMEKHAELHQEWNANKAKYKNELMPEPALKRQLEIIETITAKDPAWIDGLWMVAEAAFQLGASYQDEKDLPFARSIFVRGQKSAEKCIEKKSDHPICQLFLGAMIGKIASIDGIFSSLKKAPLVEKLWLAVINSKYNHNFGHESSLQGSTRYALGMFYRLVPDFFLMKWLFDVKGDIKKSVKYHREALAVDPPNPCTKIMLAAALLCSVKGDTKSEDGKEGLKQLRETQQMTVKSLFARACQNDTIRLEKEPGKACGYETARQQESSEEDFKKQKALGH